MSTLNMEEKLKLEKKLQMFFHHLNSLSDFPIEDDTVLQKVQSTLRGLVNKQEKSLIWCEKIGLISFVTSTLEESCISQEKNHSLAAFALSCFSSVVEEEETFLSLSENKVMNNFRRCLSVSHTNMTLIANLLLVTESLIKHQAGLHWIIRNNIWENFLHFLKSPNIFIKKSCTKVLIAILLYVKDSQKVNKYVHDLEHLLYDVQEDNNDVRPFIINYKTNFDIVLSVAKLESSTQDILQFFHNLLMEALGKKSLYENVKPLHDLCFQILHHELNSPPEGIIMISKLLLLITIHKNLFLGSKEIGFSVDSFHLDIMSLMDNMTSKGYYYEFNRSSFEMYKYWNYLIQNTSETGKDTSHPMSVPNFFMLFHILPLHALCCKTFLVVSAETDETSNKEDYEKWREIAFQEIIGNCKQEFRIKKVLELNLQNVFQDSQRIEEQCTSQLMNFSSVSNQINLTCARYLVQTIIFLVKWKTSVKYLIDSDTRFYLHLLSLLKSLIESYEIDWDNCKEAVSLHLSLCNLIRIRGINTRVKVISFQIMKTCIEKSIYPWHTLEAKRGSALDLKNLEKDYYFHVLETATSYLSDTEWEVRDSALEVIWRTVKIQKLESEPFFTLFNKFNIRSIVLQAVGDVEPYVQASALNVLSAIVDVDKILEEAEEKEVKEKALRAIVKSGEVSIRRSAFRLLLSLLVSSKFQEEETKKFVIPVVQSTCSDPDDEVRLLSVIILRRHLFSKLEKIGVSDANMTETTPTVYNYADFRISKELENQILEILTRFFMNGCFHCILSRLDDNAEKVASEAKNISESISLIVNKYKLKDKLSTSLRSKKIKSSCEESSEVLRFESPTSLEAANSEIEQILQTSDFAVISKLKNHENGNKTFWWNSTPANEYLNPDEIPFQSTYINENCIIDFIENGLQTIKGDESSIMEEMHMLLDDIFLVIRSPHSENESRSQDCY